MSDTLETSRHCKPQTPRHICGKIGETRRMWYLVSPSSYWWKDQQFWARYLVSPSSYWWKDQQFWARLDGVLMAYGQSDTKCGSLSPHVRWGVTCPLCTQENSFGLFPERFVFLTSGANASVHLFWNNSRSCDYAQRDLTTRSLQKGISFMLINDTSWIAWVKVVMLLVTGFFFPLTFLKTGAVTWPQDVVSPDRLCETFQSACCYLASSDLFSGCKKFKLMKPPRTNSRSRTFLFTTASHGRSSFVHFGLLRVAEQKCRHVGLCEMCIWRVRVPEGRAIYNRCVYFRGEDDERAFHLNTCFGGSKIATEDNIGRDQKWRGLYHIEIIPNLDRPPK